MSKRNARAVRETHGLAMHEADECQRRAGARETGGPGMLALDQAEGDAAKDQPQDGAATEPAKPG